MSREHYLPSMKAIVSVDKNWGIGYQGELLYHLRKDMDNFKEQTMGNIIIMGRKTLESFPGGKPLPGRLNIVLTQENVPRLREECDYPNLLIFENKEKVIEYLATNARGRKIFVIGGESIYKLFDDCIDEIIITIVDDLRPADAFFVKGREMDRWSLISESEKIVEDGISYVIRDYSVQNSINSILVTGASGMIGRALLRALCERGIQTFAVVREGGARDVIPEDAENAKVIECNIDSYSELPRLIGQSVDAVVHLAWDGTYGGSRNNLYGQLENVRYTLDLVEAARKMNCKVFLGAGSQAECGRLPEGTKISADMPANPETGYGITKSCAMSMSRAMCNEYNIRHIWTRILSVYGPYDKDRTMVMSGIVSMLSGESPKYTKAEQLWDYIYCDDVARAIFLLLENGKNGRVYPIGGGKERRLSEYIEDIRDAVSPDMEIRFGEVEYYDKQVMYLCADISELTEDTGFVPEISFEEGIRKTVEWKKKQLSM